MKIIDRNGRLFGKISVIDLLVVAVVAVMAAALWFKGSQPHTGTSVPDRTITFQIRAMGIRTYVADSIRVGDAVYDKDYSSGGGPVGRITAVEVERDPGTAIASMDDGTAAMVEVEDSVDLLITVEGSGLYDGKSWSINRVYDLGVNSARTYLTARSQFTGMVADIW